VTSFSGYELCDITKFDHTGWFSHAVIFVQIEKHLLQMFNVQ